MVNKYPDTIIIAELGVWKNTEKQIVERLPQLYLQSPKKKSYKSNNLLGFYSKVLISNNKSDSAYRLFDSGVSSRFIDLRFARILELASEMYGIRK
jgi:hypothetical protein